MSTKAEKRVAAAKRDILRATVDAAAHLAHLYLEKNPDVPASDPLAHFEAYWPDICEAVVPVVRRIAAKRAGYKSWNEFEAARARIEGEAA
jgi:hypothetical protein